MTIHADDPRLTAYALGELESDAREAIEKELERNPEARRAVEEIRAAGERLAATLGEETGPALTGAQRQAIEAELAGPARTGVVSIFRLVAVAAGLALMVGVGVLAALGAFDSGDRDADPRIEARVHDGYTNADASVPESWPRKIQFHFNTVQQDEKNKATYRLKNRDALAGMRWEPSRPGDQAVAGAAKPERSVMALNRSSAARYAYNGSSGSVPPNMQPPVGHPYPGTSSVRIPNMQPPGAPAPVSNPAPGMVAPSGAVAGWRVVTGAVPSESESAGFFVGRKAGSEKADGRSRTAQDHRRQGPNTEAYDAIQENPFQSPWQAPLSTFSIDVDTASYTNVRRFLDHHTRPPRGAVRIEEFVNYFDYGYAEPIDEHPFSAHVEVAGCPWCPGHRLVRIGLKGRTVEAEKRPATNLVFLLDVSGSMAPANKLPLVQKAMLELTARLDERDRVGIVTYSGTSGVALASTPGHEKDVIGGAIQQLQARGSTNGEAGLQMAYKMAVENFIQGGVNRVILCTDGDFNVGVTSRSELFQVIQDRARTGVFLSVLGFGMGNLKDATLEMLADKGNGHYAYIDGMDEARKVLVEGMAGTLITIAKDVKIQLEFNPRKVKAYRLLGYENRVLAAQDFNDDKKDAGEIGAGHTVTALYEIVPTDGTTTKPKTPTVDALKYQDGSRISAEGQSEDLLTLKLRYKRPDEEKSVKMEVPASDPGGSYSQASRDFKFAAAVASFAMILRDSAFKGNATLDQILELADEGKGPDPSGRRAGFLELVTKARAILK